MSSKNQEVITFKVDSALLELLKGVTNRSEFIRSAILTALESACPFCKGSGVLSAGTRKHWDEFSKDHTLEECGDCNEIKIECAK